MSPVQVLICLECDIVLETSIRSFGSSIQCKFLLETHHKFFTLTHNVTSSGTQSENTVFAAEKNVFIRWHSIMRHHLKFKQILFSPR